jgi:hypothetical protein
MIAHKISAADTLCKCAKKLSNLEYTVRIRATAHARDGSSHSGGAVFPVHCNEVRGPGADKAVKDLRNVTHTHTQIYIHLYKIYILYLY